MLGQRLVERLREEARQERQEAGPPAHDDLVERNFTASAANELWLTDITEHATCEGRLYLCAIKDVYSNRIVGYSISDRMEASLAVDALRCAVQRRDADVAGCVVHSDRDSQGGFNRSSQHLDLGGVQGWQRRSGAGRPARCPRGFADSGVPIELSGPRCARPVVRNPRERCSGSFGG